MSAMAFREPNQVLWRGYRPGHNGTQVTVSNSAVNATVVVYTVGATVAGGALYITDWTFSAYFGAAGNTYLFVRNGADVTQYNIATILGPLNADVAMAGTPGVPIEVPNGWDICLQSQQALVYCYGFIHGFEQV